MSKGFGALETDAAALLLLTQFAEGGEVAPAERAFVTIETEESNVEGAVA